MLARDGLQVAHDAVGNVVGHDGLESNLGIRRAVAFANRAATGAATRKGRVAGRAKFDKLGCLLILLLRVV